MSKGDHIEVSGRVVDAQAAGIFRIQLDDSDSVVIARLSGKMRIGKIRVTEGDSVIVALSPYDMTNGLIIWRK